MTNNQNCRKDAKKEQKKREKQMLRKDKLEILLQQFQKQSASARKEPTIIKITKDENSFNSNGLHQKMSCTSLPTTGLRIKDFARDISKEENISEQQLWTTNTRLVHLKTSFKFFIIYHDYCLLVRIGVGPECIFLFSYT